MSRVRLSDKQAEVFWYIQDCQEKKLHRENEGITKSDQDFEKL